MTARLPNVLAALAALAALSSPWSCAHTPPKSSTAASTAWTDTDSSDAATDFVAQIDKSPWAKNYAKANPGKKAKVLVNDFTNRTEQHLDMIRFGKLLQDALAKSKKLQVAKVKKDGEFILGGNIAEATHVQGDSKVVTYRVAATLTNLKTFEDEWTAKREVKKSIRR